MANLFDLSAGLTISNNLLPDNPNPDDLSPSRSLSNMPMSQCSPSKNQVEDKKTSSQMRRTSSGQKSLWTPMKALIAEEMSKNIETRPLRPNVVAKLMGLEAFPQKKPHLCDQKNQLRTCQDISHAPAERAAEFWEDKEVQKKLLKFHQSKDCTGFHETLQQSDNPNAVSEQLLQNGRWDRGKHEKKMALVRHKFIEAKRLLTDKKLRHTKEFQDALEALSSNRELFLSFQQEPNHLYSGNLSDLQSLPCKTKRITILRPSKMVDHENFSMTGNQNDKLMKQPSLVTEPTRLDVDDAEHVYDCADGDSKDCPPQLTRIVVLKPSSGKIGDMKTSSSPCYEDVNCDGKLESSDVAGEIPRKLQENLVSDRKDGILLSSVYSDDYTVDDSSFYKSEGEAIGNLSDSEVITSPPSRHSWDFINKVGSPYSLSSFSHAAYSPESLVCREAKRRLSERWALMASHETFSEQRHVRKDSNTLGKMLALLDTNNKKSVRAEESASGKEQQLIGSPSWLISDSNKEEVLVDSPKCLMRSKSLPVSSSIFSDNLNVDAVDPRMGKSNAQKGVVKKGNAKPSSFKGKVSRLLFFMSRKSKKETSGKPRHEDKIQSAAVDSLGELMEAKICDDTSEIGNDNCLGPCSSPSQSRSLQEEANVHRSGGTVANEVELTGSKSAVPGSKDNLDHQSPISVLDPSFDEDDSLTSESSVDQGPVLPLRFNLIDKSPPIGSIARTLSWDDDINKSATPYFSKSPTVSPVKEEALDWLTFVQTLLSEAGFDGQLSLHAFISRWYSSESPLDPSLREKFTNVNDKGVIMTGAKRRQKISERKLAYDCVNKALVNVGGLLHGPYVQARGGDEPTTLSRVRDCVWTQMKVWLSDEVRCVSKDDGDSNSLLVEKVVRKEVVGQGWADHLATGKDCLVKNIELKLLDELIDEAVTDMTGRL